VVRRSADLAGNDGWTPLYIASRDPQAIRRCDEKGAGLDTAEGSNRNRVLMMSPNNRSNKSDDWLVLDVVSRHGKFYSVDNRRLLIMHMYSRRTQSYNLRVRARVKHWDSTFDRYLEDCDTANDGASITVRGGGH